MTVAGARMVVLALLASNITAMLTIALSSNGILKGIAAIWIALWLTLAELVPVGSMLGDDVY
jgi:hypothetical protein